MNILDVFIIFILGLFLLAGMYRGFVSSLYKLVSYLLSLLLTFLLYPLFAKLLFFNNSIVKNFRFYAEGAEKLENISQAAIPVAELGESEMSQLIQQSLEKSSNGLRAPLDRMVFNNMRRGVFPSIFTAGEYVNETLVAVAINLVAFLLIFFLLKLFFNTVINIYENALPFPVLRQYDTLSGGLIGLLEGILLLMVVFSVVPLLTSIMTVKPLEDILNTSLLGNFFVRLNFIPHLIRSKV